MSEVTVWAGARDADALLDMIQPTNPINVDDSIAIFELMRPMVLGAFKLDIMHDKTTIHVKVYDGRGLLIYERKLVAA